MTKNRFRRAAPLLALAAAVATLGCQSAAAAEPPPGPTPTMEQLQRRLASVGSLIESSSGAKQIESSQNGDARARRAAARELHRSAQQALGAGDLQRATQQLDLAARTMFEGVRLASPEQITGKKERGDFDARLEATRALLQAQKRIAVEKGGGGRSAELARTVETLTGEAIALADAGKIAEGRKTIDQAYIVAKAAIGDMRGGDTLVRSLSFASKEEEYRYEVDRNDTHRMLIEVLLREKRGSAGLDAMIDASVREAARLRGVAEEMATRRDYEGGIRTLEDSTRELVRAIRSAGVYIPG
jgi:hypothetical protein